MNFLNKKLLLIFVALFFTVFLGVAVTSASTINTAPSTSLNSGLVGLWSFDGKDMTGGRAIDRSGQGNNGTLSGIATSTFYVMGKIGQAGNFDGTNDYVNADSIAASSFFDGAHTVSVWGKLASWSANQTIVGASHTVITHYSEVDYSGTTKRINCRTTTGGGTNDIASINTYDGDSAWHHIAWTVNASGHIVGCYIDGVLQGTGSTNVSLASVTKFYIGQLPWNSSNVNPWNGKIDEVRVYNRVLTAAEVKRLYQMGVTSKQNVVPTSAPTLNTGLVGLWSFDGKDITNGRINDTSGQSNHGNTSGIASSTFYAQGKIGQAANFDGVNDYVSISGGGGLNAASTGSISMWVKWNGTQVGTAVLGRQSNGQWSDSRIYLDTTNPNTAHVQWVGRGGDAALPGSRIVGDGIWRHIVITFAPGSQKSYFDGALDVSDTQSTVLHDNSAIALSIGAWIGDGNNYSKTTIDEVRVYNRALSASEVKRLYNMGRPTVVGDYDKYYNNVVLLLNMDGANNSTTFTDSSRYRRTTTVAGNTKISTAQKKYGSASGAFDGSGDYLDSDGSTDFEFPGNFTIECWARFTGIGAYGLYDSRSSYTTGYISLRLHESGIMVFENPGVVITGTTAIVADRWYHIAVSRSGSSIKMFLNGVQEGSTYSSSSTFLSSASMPSFGRNSFFGGGNMNGYVDDLRVTKGVARYTGTFTPPRRQLPAKGQ